MRFTLVLFFLFSLSAFGSVKIQEELYVPGQRPEVLKDMVRSGSVIIDHVSSEGFELYGPLGLSKYLDQKNIFYLNKKFINQKALNFYPSSAQIAQGLKELAAKYPKIMKLFSIGKSVKGNDLLVMKISDNVNQDEVEPEFKYISSMHGDEITGRELMMIFIDEIGKKYGKDQEITELVNNTEIFIMPSMNPDGSDMRQRANARWRDLNRNFPDQTTDRESSPEGREPETQAVMNFSTQRKFSLSANFHGGTIVANYPWDSKIDQHPLDDLVMQLSLGYSERNPEMRSSREFPGGITNGAQWYVVRGGMQDWSYVWHNDLQITIELSHMKWPSYSDIPGFYQDNRDSMVYYMKKIHQGAGFKFKRPNISGQVQIQQTGPFTKNLGSYAFGGSEFYKVLPAGDYTFRIQEKNQAPKFVNVRVEDDFIAANGNYLTLN